MAISDDFTIDVDNRIIYHSSGTTVYSVNELYSWLMDYFDESTTIDDTIPMTAQTPTSYTLVNSWYINENYYSSFEYLNGGSIKTDQWNATTYNTGIRVLTFQSGGYTNCVVGDIGDEVGYSGGSPADTGTLLDFDNTNRIWWVRIDDTGDTFANTGTAIDLDNGSGTGAGTLSSASTTGEAIFTNIYTLGTLQSNTQIYLYQNGAEISPWWSTGHIDVLAKTKQAGTFIDNGYLTVLARHYSKLYDHFVTDLSAGARTPIPLATFADSNNTSGYRQMVLTTASADFTVGEVIEDDSDSTIQGIVTANSGTAPNITLQYYLFNSAQTDFSTGTGGFTGQTSGSTATAVAPTNVGPATSLGIGFTFGATSQDLNNGNGSRPYDCIIDCNSNTLTDTYEYLKYVTRYGSSTSLNGHTGEDYVAVGDIRLPYDAQTGNYSEGLTVTGGTSDATGIIVADHDDGTSGALVLQDVVGNFEDNETITDTGSGSASVDLSSDLDEIAPTKQSPFGTFAGGKFFGARGVWLSNVAGSDASNFELTDSTNARQVPPQTISISVTGLAVGDRVGVFKATGDNNTVDKSQYNIDQSHSSGVSYIRIEETIPNDTPSTGTIRVVRRDGSGTVIDEQRYSYTAWDNDDQPSYSEFTLSSVTTQTYDTDDTVYVPYLDEQATGASVSANVTYVSDRYVTTRVRRLRVLPFIVQGQITSSGLSVSAIRTTDTIAD